MTRSFTPPIPQLMLSDTFHPRLFMNPEQLAPVPPGSPMIVASSVTTGFACRFEAAPDSFPVIVLNKMSPDDPMLRPPPDDSSPDVPLVPALPPDPPVPPRLP